MIEFLSGLAIGLTTGYFASSPAPAVPISSGTHVVIERCFSGLCLGAEPVTASDTAITFSDGSSLALSRKSFIFAGKDELGQALNVYEIAGDTQLYITDLYLELLGPGRSGRFVKTEKLTTYLEKVKQ